MRTNELLTTIDSAEKAQAKRSGQGELPVIKGGCTNRSKSTWWTRAAMASSFGARLMRRHARSAVAGGIVALSLFLLPGQAAAAPENYRLFRFDLGGLYTHMYGTGDKGGGLLLEPMFNITDQLSAGLRQEIVFAGGGKIGSSTEKLSARFQTSFMAKAEYYLTEEGPIRPFVGGGAGAYILVAGDSNGSNSSGIAGTFFGGALQAGIELGVFRLSLLYEAILGAHAQAQGTVNTNGPVGQVTQKRLDFVGVEMSFRIGGGRREKSPE